MSKGAKAEFQPLPEEWINITEDGGIRKWKIKNGTGAKPRNLQKVAIHYVGKLDDGTVFDSSREEGKPLDFVVGKEQIKGFSEAVKTMIGREVANFIFAPEYGYGAEGNEELKVPPNATLHYEIELLYILEDMPKEEAIKEAERLNKEAGDLYRAGDYENSAILYHEAQQVLCIQQGDDITPIIQKLRSNLSAVYGKLHKWGQSLHNAENYLRWDKENLKVLSRKLDCYIGLARTDEADKLLKKCVKIAEKNNDESSKRAFLAKQKEIDRVKAEMKVVSENAYNRLAGAKIFG